MPLGHVKFGVVYPESSYKIILHSKDPKIVIVDIIIFNNNIFIEPGLESCAELLVPSVGS